MMITKKEIINNPENWRDTKGLNLDCFDEIHKISNSFFLKEKNKDEVLYGNYNPESKFFDCYRMGSIDKFSVNRENISHFISFPSIDFDLSSIKWRNTITIIMPDDTRNWVNSPRAE